MKSSLKRKMKAKKESVETLPYPTAVLSQAIEIDSSQAGSFCPNCNARLQGRQCKLFCPRPGCGYVVTCSEW